MAETHNPYDYPAHSDSPVGGRVEQAETPAEGSLVLSTVGAAAGAGLGALIWFCVAYVSGLEFGYIAVACGALAGWGAAWLGGVKNDTVGVIAALVGVVGIFLGSYFSHYHGMHVEMAKAECQRDFFLTQQMEDSQWDQRSLEEKVALFEEVWRAKAESPEAGYFATLASEPVDLVIVLLFGGFGLYYGYRYGSGQTGGGMW